MEWQIVQMKCIVVSICHQCTLVFSLRLLGNVQGTEFQIGTFRHPNKWQFPYIEQWVVRELRHNLTQPVSFDTIVFSELYLAPFCFFGIVSPGVQLILGCNEVRKIQKHLFLLINSDDICNCRQIFSQLCVLQLASVQYFH